MVKINCLREIIKIIENIPIGTQIVYAGNGRYIPLINAVLKQKGNKKSIDCYVDFTKNNWGKTVFDIFPSEYYKRLFSGENGINVIVKDPMEIIKTEEPKAYIIQAVDGEELRDKLVGLGACEEDIHLFSKGSREILRMNDVIEKLVAKREMLSLYEMQRIELNILDEFHYFCKKNNLIYYLSSGSLLGAIRHKGFIPWDDDIDVYMPYGDYKRFMEIYPKGEKYEALCWENEDDYFLTFGKLCDKSTILLHPGFPICGCIGVYIDIFPLAEYPIDEEKESFWAENAKLEQEWMDCITARDLLGDGILDVRNEIMQKRYPQGKQKSGYVGARHYLSYVKPWCVREEIYSSTVPVEFEGRFYDAPIGWEELLTERYGDYMKMPPKEKQITHMFEAYI